MSLVLLTVVRDLEMENPAPISHQTETWKRLLFDLFFQIKFNDHKTSDQLFFVFLPCLFNEQPHWPGRIGIIVIRVRVVQQGIEDFLLDFWRVILQIPGNNHRLLFCCSWRLFLPFYLMTIVSSPWVIWSPDVETTTCWSSNDTWSFISFPDCPDCCNRMVWPEPFMRETISARVVGMDPPPLGTII